MTIFDELQQIHSVRICERAKARVVKVQQMDMRQFLHLRALPLIKVVNPVLVCHNRLRNSLNHDRISVKRIGHCGLPELSV